MFVYDTVANSRANRPILANTCMLNQIFTQAWLTHPNTPTHTHALAHSLTSCYVALHIVDVLKTVAKLNLVNDNILL